MRGAPAWRVRAPAAGPGGRSGRGGENGGRRFRYTAGHMPLPSSDERALQAQLAQYRTPDRAKGLGQIANSLLPYIAGIIAMGALSQVSYWLALLLAVPTAGFMVRVFILFHDAGHGSLFRDARWNRFIGYLTGIIVFTPFRHWTHEHARHHATSGDLDRRDLGDVWTMTVDEFMAASFPLRLVYRLFRNPLVLFFLISPFGHLVYNRLPVPGIDRRALWAIIWTNLGVVLFVVLMSLPFGFVNFVLTFLPVMIVASAVGTWLFYVQHQFEGVYWSRAGTWNYSCAALRGSSYLRLPKILQFFTGSIGYHHIHHLAPRIPNYNLERAQREVPALQAVPALRFRDVIHSLTLRLYDEAGDQMVSFREGLRRARLAAAAGAAV